MARAASSIERLCYELTTRYGSVESMFVVLDRLRADSAASTAVLPVVAPAARGRHRARDPAPVTQETPGLAVAVSPSVVVAASNLRCARP